MGGRKGRFRSRLAAGVRRALLFAGLLAAIAVAGFGGRWVFSHATAIRRLASGPSDTVFLDAEGNGWFPLDPRRREIALGRVAPSLRAAVVAIEDHRFFSHHGIDPLAVARALARNLRAGGVTEGASTITQQLARTLFLSRERSLGRKAREAALALLLETMLSKERILELYLNHVPLGGVYGVETFAREFFGKSAADITLAEAALVAGVIRAPSALSPRFHFDEAVSRSRVVLSRMRATGSITAAQERAALGQRVRVAPAPPADLTRSGYAQEYLRRVFRQRAGDEDPVGWRIRTSFQIALQRAAEEAVAGGLARLARPGLQAALVAIDPQTGDLLALVGGSDFRAFPFNRANLARRQTGSAFKPFVYAAGLARGGSPVTRVPGIASPGFAEALSGSGSRAAPDDPAAFLTWREALSVSDNEAAVAVLRSVGNPAVLDLALRVGLPAQPDVPSLALGTGQATPLELTVAYTPFANGGWAVDTRAIRAIEDQRGATVYEDAGARRRVLAPTVAFQALSMLRDVVTRGTGGAAQSLGFPVAGKTGTTDDYRDAWFVGFSSRLVAGVWVGFDQPKPIGEGAFAAKVALPIWTAFMRRAAATLPPEDFAAPRELQAVELCSVSFETPLERCPTYTEYFKAGDVVPQRPCPIHGGSLRQLVGRAVVGFFERVRSLFRRR
ncbi:MAG: transglycosylase domain-containing protein [Candidatus Methylomirabilia bacterium]